MYKKNLTWFLIIHLAFHACISYIYIKIHEKSRKKNSKLNRNCNTEEQKSQLDYTYLSDQKVSGKPLLCIYFYSRAQSPAAFLAVFHIKHQACSRVTPKNSVW